VLDNLFHVRSDHAVPAGFLGGVEPFIGLGEHTLDAIGSDSDTKRRCDVNSAGGCGLDAAAPPISLGRKL
jgi:hypothetical protein